MSPRLRGGPRRRHPMRRQLDLEIQRQPDDTTCGPTSLHAVYRYFGDDVELEDVVREVTTLPGGGTLGVHLGCHALRRGYRARVYTFNLQVMDPTWFDRPGVDLAERLRLRRDARGDDRVRESCDAYMQFLALGGEVLLDDLTAQLLQRYLELGVPLLTGLSSTYLYRAMREIGPEDDDVRGDPQGHFVVLCGYSAWDRSVLIADPLASSPLVGVDRRYDVNIDRLVCAILLGVLTYDGNLLVIEPREDAP